jgi:hypothetical protein
MESGELVAARCMGVLGAKVGARWGAVRRGGRWGGSKQGGPSGLRGSEAAASGNGSWRPTAVRARAGETRAGASWGRRGGELELAGGRRAAEWRKEAARVWRSVAELEASSGAGPERGREPAGRVGRLGPGRTRCGGAGRRS